VDEPEVVWRRAGREVSESYDRGERERLNREPCLMRGMFCALDFKLAKSLSARSSNWIINILDVVADGKDNLCSKRTSVIVLRWATADGCESVRHSQRRSFDDLSGHPFD